MNFNFCTFAGNVAAYGSALQLVVDHTQICMVPLFGVTKDRIL